MSYEEMVIKEFKEKKARRDLFTAAVLTGLLASGQYGDGARTDNGIRDIPEKIAREIATDAFFIADTTIEEMDKKDD